MGGEATERSHRYFLLFLWRRGAKYEACGRAVPKRVPHLEKTIMIAPCMASFMPCSGVEASNRDVKQGFLCS